MRTRFHRNPIEFQFTRVWESVLNLDDVMPWDDFFDLGGDSITAMQVIAETDRRTGFRFTLRDLLESRTVENLVSLMAEERSILAGPVVELNKLPSSTSVLFPHSASGEVFYLRALGDRLGTNMIGLRASGLDDPDSTDTSIRDMAVRYAESVRPRLEGARVLLAGYSLGAFVAVEMIKALGDLGVHASGLILIEPPPVAESESDYGTFDQYLQQRYLHLRSNYNLVDEDDADLLVGEIRRAGAIAPVTSDAEFARAQRVWAHNMVAADHYRPPDRVDVPAVVYHSSIDDTEKSRRQWHSRTSNIVRIREFASDHFAILRDPHMLESLRIDIDELSEPTPDDR